MRPDLADLNLELQKILDPTKPKVLSMLAKGLAPVPAPLLVSSWCYLSEDTDQSLAESATNSLTKYPEKMLLPVLSAEVEPWVLGFLGLKFRDREDFLELILLNQQTPNELFVELAKTVSEKLTVLISNNQERLIECPAILVSLESNPQNLKSNTDRLRHFLRLAGIGIPGDAPAVEQDEVAALSSEQLEEANEAEAATATTPLAEKIVEENKKSLLAYITALNVAGRVKLAFKGNKEARGILIRDTNRIVGMAVLKSPRLTENEVARYCILRNVNEDVIRTIAAHAPWTKAYAVKLGLCFNPKTPLQQSMQFIRFLNFRDLQRVAKARDIPSPLQKASKELLRLKRK